MAADHRIEIDLDYDVDGLDDFRRAAAALKKIDRDIPREVLKVIRREASAAKKEASAKVLQQPALKGKHTGLRKDIARGVGLVPFTEGERQGWRVTTSMPEEDEAIIPRGMDSPRKGWRHPVFGRRDTWVRQYGAFSWFMDSMQELDEEITPKLEEVLEDAADTVDKAAQG